MAEDPVLVAETRAWLLKAANDLRAASHDLKSIPPLMVMRRFIVSR